MLRRFWLRLLEVATGDKELRETPAQGAAIPIAPVPTTAPEHVSTVVPSSDLDRVAPGPTAHAIELTPPLTNWRSSPSHGLLFVRRTHPTWPTELTADPFWDVRLREPRGKALVRFVMEGFVEIPPASVVLAHHYTTESLATVLRAHGLPVGRNERELVARLMTLLPDQAQALIDAKPAVYVQTAAGSQFATMWRVQFAAEEADAIQRVDALIGQRDLEGAYRAWLAWNATLVFPSIAVRGVNHRLHLDSARLEEVRHILDDAPPDRAVRIAGELMFGEPPSTPADKVYRTRAAYARDMARDRNIAGIQIMIKSDACLQCRSLGGCYRLDDTPVSFPPLGCDHEWPCGAYWQVIFSDEEPPSPWRA